MPVSQMLPSQSVFFYYGYYFFYPEKPARCCLS